MITGFSVLANIVLHSLIVFDDLNSMQNCDIVA